MRKDLQRWLNSAPLTDPIERRQATIFQIMLIVLVASDILLLPMMLLNPNQPQLRPFFLAAPLLSGAFNSAALWMLRRGRFKLAVITSTAGMFVTLAIFMLITGLHDSGSLLFTFAIPIAMAALLAGRRGLVIATVLSVAIVLLVAAADTYVTTMLRRAWDQQSATIITVSTFMLSAVVLALFFDRFGGSLRDALETALKREHELEALRDSLELTVAERTASLEAALTTVKQREARLAETLDDLRASQEAVRALSAPVIPVLPGVLVAPLIGALDSARAALLTESVLNRVAREHARHVIFDITGTPVVDTHVAQVLIQTATAVRLLGADVLLVGIRPEVAQTMVALNIDMRAIRTYTDLREAVTALLAARSLPQMKGVVSRHMKQTAPQVD